MNTFFRLSILCLFFSSCLVFVCCGTEKENSPLPKNESVQLLENQENSEVSQKLRIEGMTCNSCVNFITKSVSRLKGVSNCEVNLKEESCQVRFDPKQLSIKSIIAVIEKGGYKVSLWENAPSSSTPLPETEKE